MGTSRIHFSPASYSAEGSNGHQCFVSIKQVTKLKYCARMPRETQLKTKNPRPAMMTGPGLFFPFRGSVWGRVHAVNVLRDYPYAAISARGEYGYRRPERAH